MSVEASIRGKGSDAGGVRAPWWSGWVHPKGNIEPQIAWLLLVAASLPLVLAFSRMLAMPGVEPPAIFGLDHLRELGRALNQSLSLEWVPPSDRPRVLYLLLLPTGALLVALARLTFGLRVLGLRAILIAIGFQEIGFVPSFALMIVVIGTIVLIRPSMRSIRLPLYARITIVLCVAAGIMVSALLLGPWVHSEALWSVAFFPVIIMAMLAEGIAKMFARDDAVYAAWRLAWTIVLALVIAVVGQTTVIGDFALHFPELMLTQVLAIVFVAEYLDLRLLERWPERLKRLIEGERPWYHEKPRIALIRNRWSPGVIGRLGRPAPRKYRKRSVQRAVDALRDQGFQVKVLEGDTDLLNELDGFMPSDPRTGAPRGIALNLATGVQGTGRFCHVPAMLEMAGVPYTGPDPVAHARLSDRYVLLKLLSERGVPVPACALVGPGTWRADLEFPLGVGPRFEPDAGRVRVEDSQALEEAVRDRIETYGQDVVVEEWLAGPEWRIALIGNEVIECLPVLEYRPEERRKTCPATLSDEQASRVHECACLAYRTVGCRDYGRVDIRLSRNGEPVVVDVKWADLFARRGSFVRAAEVAGYELGDLFRRIVDVAALRYAAMPALRARQPPPESEVVALGSRRAGAAAAGSRR